MKSNSRWIILIQLPPSNNGDTTLSIKITANDVTSSEPGLPEVVEKKKWNHIRLSSSSIFIQEFLLTSTTNNTAQGPLQRNCHHHQRVPLRFYKPYSADKRLAFRFIENFNHWLSTCWRLTKARRSAKLNHTWSQDQHYTFIALHMTRVDNMLYWSLFRGKIGRFWVWEYMGRFDNNVLAYVKKVK